MKKFIVYEVKNNLNGKIYIGQYSGSNFENYFGSGKLIKAAIQKYGLENFTKSILEECGSKEELNSREIYWIREKKSREEGYNLTEGGTGGDTSNFIDYTDPEYIKKKSEVTKQYWDSLSDEDRELRSISVRGSKNGMYGKEGYWKGKQKSVELVKKCVSSRRSYEGEDNPNWKGGISNSTCEVCDKKISQGATRCMEHIKYERSGVNNPFYGKTHSEETKQKLRECANNRTTKPNNSKRLMADGVLYSTASEAARAFGITRGLVNYRCKSNKYDWKFVD